MSSFSFPPYGEFARYYNDLVAPLELPPTAWKPNLPPSDRYASWIEWREETLSVCGRNGTRQDADGYPPT